MNDYSRFIAMSRYARFLPDEGRRETWGETVDRYIDELVYPALHGTSMRGGEVAGLAGDLRSAIKNMDVLPSMRALYTAGPALNEDDTACYNCAYLPVDKVEAFSEALYILMRGTGVGYSVERKYVDKLPTVPNAFEDIGAVYVVDDSKEGWAGAVGDLLKLLYAGKDVQFDLSQIRPKGAILRTFGGRASGPEPLRKALDFIRETVMNASGRKLLPIECHDILCSIGDAVVSGGVRRSALLSLSDLDDKSMAQAKSTFLVDEYKLLDESDTSWTYAITMKRGQPVRPTYRVTLSKETQQDDHRLLERGKKVGWWVVEPQRALANNSVAYEKKPAFAEFLAEMHHLHQSYSGERGIFFRGAAAKAAGRSGRRDVDHDWGTNPCSEIILRPNQFCNLTTVVVRPEDTLQDLSHKVQLATTLGTIQATRTNFPKLSEAWTKNTEEERLLGVSLTGVMDHPVLQDGEIGRDGFESEAYSWLRHLRQQAVNQNRVMAAALGIPQATAVTCVKPEGTVSQLTDTASGLHPRWAPFYIRRVRESSTNQLAQFMASQGVPFVMDKDDYVFEFPMKSPEDSVFRNDLTAVQQLEHWLMIQRNWAEHKPSITVYYSDDEFFEMAQWLWDNFDELSGVALLPRDSGTYRLAPYEDITEAEYERRVAEFPAMIHWDAFRESEDNTVGAQTLACIGASCEIP